MSGRVSKVPADKIKQEILNRKNEIVNDDNKIVPKTNKVWAELSDCFSNLIQGKSLHAMVCGNRHGIRDALLGEVSRVPGDDSIESNVSFTGESNDDYIFNKQEEVSFTIEIPRRDFVKMTDPTAKRKKTIPGKRPQIVQRLIFIPYMWESYFSRKIWDAISIRCGFQFKSHSLSKDGTQGSVNEYNEDEVPEPTDENLEFIPEDEAETESQRALTRNNHWYRWGHDIYNECSKHFATQSPDYNAFYIQGVNFTERLLHDISLIPIWSCMYNSNFGRNRDPATSSAVENEFNKFKHAIMRDQGKQVRVDTLVDNHLDYLIGKFRIIEAEMNLNERKKKEAEKIDEIDEESMEQVLDNDANVCGRKRGRSSSSDYMDVSEFLQENQPVIDSDRSVGPPCCVCGLEIYENKVLSCTKCGKNVHSVDCVDPYSEEVVCTNCQVNKENLGLEDVENWGGLATKDTRRKRRKIIEPNKPAHQAPKKRMKNCAPCAAGYEMSAHKCIKCHKKVHAIEECSYPFDDDEEKRICFNCKFTTVDPEHADEDSSVAEVTASVTRPTGRKNLYLGGNKMYVKDCLTFGARNRSAIPVMKNGSDPKLTSLKIDDQFISLTNTCAFDALLNIWLYIEADFPEVSEKLNCCEKWRDSQFKRLMTDILHREKINATDYKLRAQILHNLCQTSRSVLQEKNSVVDCNVSVPWLAQKLFHLVPSFIETTECIKCLKKLKEFPIIAPGIPDRDIKPTEIEFITKYYGILESVTDCPNKACNGKSCVRRRLTAIGNVVMFEVNNDEDSSDAIALSQIPKKIKNPLTNKLDVILFGVCCYKPPINLRKNPQASILAGDAQMGNYTSLIYRWAANSWREIDDLQITNMRTSRKDSYKIVPRLLVYITLGDQSH